MKQGLFEIQYPVPSRQVLPASGHLGWSSLTLIPAESGAAAFSPATPVPPLGVRPALRASD